MTDEYLTDEEYYSQFDDYEDHEGYESFPINDKLTLYIKKNIPENSKEICKDYWDITIDEEYKIKFVLTVNEIREKYKLHRDTVIKTAKENAYIFEEALKCYSCKEILINEKRNTRSGFYKINLNKNNNLLCDTCNKIKIEMEEKNKKKKENKNARKI
jgi:hypothetical protein